MSRGPSSPRLAECLEEFGWPEGVERFATELDDSDALWLRQELGRRHTAWKVLLGAHGRQTAFVLDGGYGSATLSLSMDFRRVYVGTPDARTAAVIRARAEHAGVHNLVFADWRFIQPDSLDAAVVYGLPETQLSGELLDTLARGLRPSASLFLGVPGFAGRTRLRALRRRCDRRFAHTRTYCYRSSTPQSSAGLASVYEFVPLAMTFGQGLRATAHTLRAWFRAPGFGIIAEKRSDLTSLVDLVLADTARRLGVEVKAQRFIFSNPNGMTVLAGPWVVRIPLSAQARTRNYVNHRALCALRAVAPPGHTPQPLLEASVEGQPYFVESALLGVAATAPVVEEAAAWITRLHVATAAPRRFDEALIDRLVVQPMRLVRESLTWADEREALDRIEHYLCKALQGQRLRLVFSHGDFALDNILTTNGERQIAGVFDWDVSEPQGLPLLDLLYLFGTEDRARRGDTMGRTFSRTILPGHFDAQAQRVIQRYCEAIDIPDHLHLPLRIMSWVHHVGVRTYNPEPYRTTRNDLDTTTNAMNAILDLIECAPVRKSV